MSKIKKLLAMILCLATLKSVPDVLMFTNVGAYSYEDFEKMGLPSVEKLAGIICRVFQPSERGRGGCASREACEIRLGALDKTELVEGSAITICVNNKGKVALYLIKEEKDKEDLYDKILNFLLRLQSKGDYFEVAVKSIAHFGGGYCEKLTKAMKEIEQERNEELSGLNSLFQAKSAQKDEILKEQRGLEAMKERFLASFREKYESDPACAELLKSKMIQISDKLDNLATAKMREIHPDVLNRLAQIPDELKDVELEINGFEQQIDLQRRRDVKDEAERAVLPETDVLGMSEMLRDYGVLRKIREKLGYEIGFWKERILLPNLIKESKAELERLARNLDAIDNPEIRALLETKVEEIEELPIGHMFRLRAEMLNKQIRVLERRKLSVESEMNGLIERLDGTDTTMGGSKNRANSLQEISDILYALMSQRERLQDEFDSSKAQGFQVFWPKIDYFISGIKDIGDEVSRISELMMKNFVKTPDEPLSDREGTLSMDESLAALKLPLDQLLSSVEGALHGAKDATESRSTKDIQDLFYPFGFALSAPLSSANRKISTIDPYDKEEEEYKDIIREIKKLEEVLKESNGAEFQRISQEIVNLKRDSEEKLKCFIDKCSKKIISAMLDVHPHLPKPSWYVDPTKTPRTY